MQIQGQPGKLCLDPASKIKENEERTKEEKDERDIEEKEEVGGRARRGRKKGGGERKKEQEEEHTKPRLHLQLSMQDRAAKAAADCASAWQSPGSISS